MVRSGEVQIESPGQMLGLVSTVSLEPAPIPLDGAKLVLAGDRILYYLLAAADPDFLELFKVLVDFEESMDRGPEAERLRSWWRRWSPPGATPLRPRGRGTSHRRAGGPPATPASCRCRCGACSICCASRPLGRRCRTATVTAADVDAARCPAAPIGRVRERLQEPSSGTTSWWTPAARPSARSTGCGPRPRRPRLRPPVGSRPASAWALVTWWTSSARSSWAAPSTRKC